ncbi:hypothetical protein [Nitratifractor sp.]|uniref:hypothetical protein n=1 Tax=Nitratifractor sp. TaxID=2268144 RepID=UPI0025F5D35A|nr:hypothetical protein [Nitratifractor sp.]
MSEYLTARQVVNKLRQGRVMKISEAYFSQLVAAGVIPYHTIPGKRRKFYLYSETKEAILSARDPSREAQRQANERKRNEGTAAALGRLIECGFKADQFTIPDTADPEEVTCELTHINTVNSVLLYLARDLFRVLPESLHDAAAVVLLEHAISRDDVQDTIEILGEEE